MFARISDIIHITEGSKANRRQFPKTRCTMPMIPIPPTKAVELIYANDPPSCMIRTKPPQLIVFHVASPNFSQLESG